jgi:hypothetical protein
MERNGNATSVGMVIMAVKSRKNSPHQRADRSIFYRFAHTFLKTSNNQELFVRSWDSSKDDSLRSRFRPLGQNPSRYNSAGSTSPTL